QARDVNNRATDSGGCFYLFFMSPLSHRRFCACPTGIRLLSDNVTCEHALSSDSKGHRLLSKMGSTEGQSLGRSQGAIIELIAAELRLLPTRGDGIGKRQGLVESVIVDDRMTWVVVNG